MHVSCFQTARQEIKEGGVDSSTLARSPSESLVIGSILAAVNRFSRFKKNDLMTLVVSISRDIVSNHEHYTPVGCLSCHVFFP